MTLSKCLLAHITLTVGFVASNAQAQSLDVGANFTIPDVTTPATAMISASGTTASGNYAYYNTGRTFAPLEANRTDYLSVDSYNTSTANISGGQVEFLTTHDASNANVYGGVIEMKILDNSIGSVFGGTQLDNLIIYQNGIANVSGGTTRIVEAYSTSTVMFSGGDIANLILYNGSTFNMTGGKIGLNLDTEDSSILNISGGTLPSHFQAHDQSIVTISGGSFSNLYAGYHVGNGTFDLLGSNLTESLMPRVGLDGLLYYTVSGTLRDSLVPFTANVYFGYNGLANGNLEFNGIPAVPGGAPVPEFSSMISLGLLLLGGAVFRIHKKKDNTNGS